MENKQQQQQQPKKQKPKNLKPSEEIEEINWFPLSDLSQGSQSVSTQEEKKEEEQSSNQLFIGLWHRPKKQHLEHLKKSKNLQNVITVQSKKEQSDAIQKECASFGINWIHLPLEGANMNLLSDIKTRQMVIDTLQEIILSLKEKKQNKFLIHCAAGIHRTGTVSYTLMRFLGYEQETCMKNLKQMRETTFNQVGDHRIKFAEDYIVQPFLNKISLKEFDQQNPINLDSYQKPKPQQKTQEQ